MRRQEYFTLKQIVKLTGAKRRSIQLWADTGVIHPVAGTQLGGSGIHRKFPKEELEIAAVLTPLARMGVTIGKLKQFSETYRTLHTKEIVRGEKQLKRDLYILDQARAGEGNNYLIYYDSPTIDNNLMFVHCEEGAAIEIPSSQKADGIVLINLNKAWGSLGR